MSHKNRIKEVLRYVEGPVVLDLGAIQHDMENTKNQWWLHKHLDNHPSVEQLVGVDLLEEAKRLNEQGYDIRVGNVETMNLDITADTVVCGELIEHLSNPGKMLESITSHIKQDGKLIITTPNPWAVVHLRRILLNGHTDINEEHTAWFGPTVLEQLLERYGFEVDVMKAVGPDHPGLTHIAKKFGYDMFGGTNWVCVSRWSDNDGS